MSIDDHRNLDSLLIQALNRPRGERQAFVDLACGSAGKLRDDLRELLRLHEQAGDFLENPALMLPDAIRDASARVPVGEKPGDVIGRYKLLEHIGEGGFGAVFMADQLEPVQRRVALKIIKLGMDTKRVIARFEAERQALALMDHPSIARVFDAGATENGRPYFVMELVRGTPITRFCDEYRLSVRQRLELFVQVCHAVQHAHTKGVIHRDLKPSNILAVRHDGRPVPKVIDFGIAKATGGRLTDKTLFTEFRQLIGTPAYMSPEQAGMSDVDSDTRSDVYSLGVLLFELLTGSTPFDAKTLLDSGYDEMRRMIREVEPPTPSQRVHSVCKTPAPVLPDASNGDSAEIARRRNTETALLARMLHGDLDWIVMKCLEKDRSRRYETAVALAEDVGRHIANEPVLAGPPSAAYRFRKFVRRHRLGVAAGSVVAVALVIGIVGTSSGMAWALREQARAVQRQGEAEAARLLAEKREKETQEVSDFQARMLSGIDVEAMGRAIKQRFREQVRASLERQWVGEYPCRRARSPTEIEAELREFDQRAEAAQGVDVARRVFDEFVLERAGNELEKLFVTQPLVRAQLRSAIGNTYLELGLYDAAEPHLLAAVEIRQHQPGVEAELLAESLRNLATVMRAKGKYARAESLLREAHDSLRGREDGGDFKIAILLGDLALLELEQGNYAAGEPLVREAIDLARKADGAESKSVTAYLGALAVCLERKGDYVEAERLFREVLEAKRRLGDDEGAAAALNNLGTLLMERRDYDAAEEMLTEALAILRKSYGQEHSKVAMPLVNLGNLHLRRNDPARAESFLREALDIRRRLQGDAHPDVALFLGGLGKALSKRGDLAGAEQALREALALRRAHGPDDALVGRLLSQLGHLLARKGKDAEAEELFRETVSVWRKLVGDAHPHVATCLKDFAEVLHQKGKWAAAEPLYGEALSILQAEPGTDGVRLAEIQHHLADCLRDMGRFEEALPLAEQAVVAFRQASKHPLSAEHVHSLEVLAEVHRDLGHPKECVELLREALPIRRANAGSWLREPYVRAVDLMVRTLQDCGEPAEAIRVQREFTDDCRLHWPADGGPLGNALGRLGLLLLDRDENTEAEAVLRECVAIREKTLSPDASRYWFLPNARSMLGGALVGRGAAQLGSNAAAAITNFSEAEPLVIEAAGWLTQNAVRIPEKYRAERPRQALQRAVRLYESWETAAPNTGKAELANRWRVELEKLSARSDQAASLPPASSSQPVRTPQPKGK